MSNKDMETDFDLGVEYAKNNPDIYPNRENTITGYILKNKEMGLLFATHSKNNGIKISRPDIGDTAVYNVNSGYFRSDEFNKRCDDGKTVLFAGCSVMYGEGHDLEDSLAHLTYQYLSKKEKLSGFFNIGVGGATGSQIITSIFDYIEIYGNPDLIIFLLPPLERDMAYFFPGPQNKWEKEYRDRITDEEAKYDYNKHVAFFNGLYKMLYLYCKTNKIDLVSSSWGEFENSKFIPPSKYGFEEMLQILYPDTYKRFDRKKIIKSIYDYSQLNPNNKYLIKAKDQMHQGVAWNHAFAKELIEIFDL